MAQGHCRLSVHGAGRNAGHQSRESNGELHLVCLGDPSCPCRTSMPVVLHQSPDQLGAALGCLGDPSQWPAWLWSDSY